MAEAIDAPAEMSLNAPRIITVKIPVDKIGEVIGPKGKVINQIQDDTGASLSIEDDGTIYIGATNGEAAEAARQAVNAIANPTMPEVGERYLGTVVKTTNFGAFVSLLPGKDGLLHISKLRVAGRWQAGRGRRGRPVAWARRSRSRSPRSTTAASCRWSRSSRSEAEPRLRPSAELRVTEQVTGRADGCTADARHDPHPPRREGRRRIRGLHGPPDRPSRRAAGRDRGDARRPLRHHRRLGGRRVARRVADACPGRRTSSSTCSSRARPTPLRAGHLGRPSTRSAASSTPSPPRSTPASTRGCSTTTCRWRSTCSATWSPPRRSRPRTSRPSVR